MSKSTGLPLALPDIEPVNTLLRRVRQELAADFSPALKIRLSRAPGRLDVMGGIADYTGSMVCQLPLDRAVAVALQPRSDRQLQVFSFNRFDQHEPFALRIPLDALARQSAAALRREFDAPGRKWAGYLAGCLFVLHDQKLIDLADPSIAGLNLAAYGTTPIGAGISSSAALETATMINLVDHWNLREKIDAMRVAELCQQVENQIVGAPCGVMDQAASCLGESGSLLRMVCQPHELLEPLELPPGVRVLGIDSGVKHDIAGSAYRRTRCAAFIGYRLILEEMRRMGVAQGRTMIGDPMRGYLANLDPGDYKKLFRPALPALMPGDEFLNHFGAPPDAAIDIEPEVQYAVQHAADHHVLEARRVRRFAEFVEQAAALSGPGCGAMLDRAGHLMYASHHSYSTDAMLGAAECDLLVKLVRQRERTGLYGARITGGGQGGTVAILADASDRADVAVGEIMIEYERQTGRTPQAFLGSSPGAWRVGTTVV